MLIDLTHCFSQNYNQLVCFGVKAQLRGPQTTVDLVAVEKELNVSWKLDNISADVHWVPVVILRCCALKVRKICSFLLA